MLKQRGHSKLTGRDLEAYNSIETGMFLYGYCCGKFGRDSYGDKLVVSKSPNHIEVVEENLAGGHEKNSAEMDSDDWFDLVQSSNNWLKEEG